MQYLIFICSLEGHLLKAFHTIFAFTNGFATVRLNSENIYIQCSHFSMLLDMVILSLIISNKI